VLLSLFCLLSHRSFALKLLMLPTLVACVGFVLYNEWSRRPLLGIAVAATAYVYRTKFAHRALSVRIASMLVIMALGLALLQFLTVTRGERFYGDASGGRLSMFSARGVESFLGGIEINYRVFEYALSEFPQNEKYLGGSGFVPAFLFVVPRSIWPEKPVSTGAVITAMWFNSDHASTNLSPSSIGECYMNFATPGVAILMFIAGKFARALNTYLRANSRNAVVWLAWLMVIPDIASEWRGDFTSMTVQPLLRVIVFIGLAWLVAKLQGQQAAPTTPTPYRMPGPIPQRRRPRGYPTI
ncbi:MAG: oligosaccharide repeat unit polymerase, partial [Phycisphaerales bacterium]|nr:oligosaccharide repeat unit polymerase [Phycisphaerales bacterium]